jgi:hypothetical protein
MCSTPSENASRHAVWVYLLVCPILAQNVDRIIHAGQKCHDDIFGYYLLHMVKQECIVMLVKLDMRVRGTLDNALGCCHQRCS